MNLKTVNNRMLDIFFISYDEPNGDENFRNLKNRFPHAKRVHGVKGIGRAYAQACERSNTNFFYIIDADSDIYDSFKFQFKPTESDSNYVFIWHAFNPATGTDYGYGGVKLFHRNFFKDVDKIESQLDFLSTNIKVIPEIACTTRFNSDPYRSYRGAFREVVKLYTTANVSKVPKKVKTEARQRLAGWMDPVETCKFREFVVAGAQDAIVEAKRRKDNPEDLMYINNNELMLTSFMKRYPSIDFNTSPIPAKDNPMRHELFFTSRIASSLYDNYVLEVLSVTELRDSISDNQTLSNLWLINELTALIKDGKIVLPQTEKAKVAVLDAWIGILPLMMNSWELPFTVTSVDRAERSNRVAEKLNYDYDFKTLTTDIGGVAYAHFDIVIHMDVEKISDVPGWRKLIPPGKIVAIQSNNQHEDDRNVSCALSANHLRTMLGLREVFYEGTRQFPHFNRFMIIGAT